MALSPDAQEVALGNSYVIGNTTGYDSVSAIPTTAGKFDVYNGDSLKCLVLRKMVVGQRVVDATQANCSALVFTMNPTVATIPTQIACKHLSLSCRTSQANATSGTLTNIIVGTGTTITNKGWFELPLLDDPGTSTAGSIMKSMFVDFATTPIILPPKTLISFAVLQLAAVTAACFFNLYYDEKGISGINGT